jgi:hypothetical protein
MDTGRVMLAPPSEVDGWTIPGLYGTPLREHRMIGRCRSAGCRHRTAVDVTVFRVANQSGAGEATMFPTGDDRKPWASVDHGGHDHRFTSSARWRASLRDGEESPALAAFERLGLFCPEHGDRLKLKTLRARTVPHVPCTVRCREAIGDTCECECGGARHAENWKR